MKEYISILDSVIRIKEIKKVEIGYNRSDGFGDKFHFVQITYKDGEVELLKTADYERAKKDFENLKSALLAIDEKC